MPNTPILFDELAAGLAALRKRLADLQTMDLQQATEKLAYGYVQAVNGPDPVITLALNVASWLNTPENLHEAELNAEQASLLAQAIACFDRQSRRTELLDNLLFTACKVTKAPVVFEALIQAGANPIKKWLLHETGVKHHEHGAVIEALIRGNPAAARVMLKDLSRAQALAVQRNLLTKGDLIPVSENFPLLEHALQAAVPAERGLQPGGLPAFLAALEKKTGPAIQLRMQILPVYLKVCIEHGHAWHEGVMKQLCGDALDPLSSPWLEKSRKAPNVLKGHSTNTLVHALAEQAVQAHCPPALQVVRPLLMALANQETGQERPFSMAGALKQHGVHVNFHFQPDNFRRTLETLLACGHNFVVDFTHDDGKPGRYTVLHDLAKHNGKNAYRDRHAKLLGLLEVGADPYVRDGAGRLAASLVKPDEDKQRWVSIIKSREARLLANQLLEEMDGQSSHCPSP